MLRIATVVSVAALITACSTAATDLIHVEYQVASLPNTPDAAANAATQLRNGGLTWTALMLNAHSPKEYELDDTVEIPGPGRGGIFGDELYGGLFKAQTVVVTDNRGNPLTLYSGKLQAVLREKSGTGPLEFVRVQFDTSDAAGAGTFVDNALVAVKTTDGQTWTANKYFRFRITSVHQGASPDRYFGEFRFAAESFSDSRLLLVSGTFALRDFQPDGDFLTR